jgi:hypothetical protein
MSTFEDQFRRAWPLFLEAIRAGRTMTYSELADRLGPPITRRVVYRKFIAPLTERCRKAGLPNLAAMVVRKDTGKPGGDWAGPNASTVEEGSWAVTLQQCLTYPWPHRVDRILFEGNRDESSERISPARRK